MIRVCAALCLVLVCLTGPAFAQDPVLTSEIDGNEVIPGQSVSLRLTVLVPTYMPDPPQWPSFEAPNLHIRVASSGPVSETIEGETWSGVSRRYLITPMVPGQVTLPALTAGVTWADPDTNAPMQVDLETEPVTITGVVPDEASELDPFIAADTLELTQSIEGEPEGMSPGASFTRSVTANIRGASPMFLPPLLPQQSVDGLRGYPDEPVTAENVDRGVVSGSRTESVTYLAEGGGSGALSAVTLKWYNLKSGAIETAELAAVDVSVEGPPARPADGNAPRDWRGTVQAAIAVLFALLVLALVVRRARGPIGQWWQATRLAWQRSEHAAWRTLLRKIKARDLAGVRHAMDVWLCVSAPDGQSNPTPDVMAALNALGHARYGQTPGDDGTAWQDLAHALTDMRRAARGERQDDPLPPLNPSPMAARSAEHGKKTV